MRKNNRDLIAAILIVGINIGWTLLPIHLLPISIILALPLTIILPGYTLTQLLLRKRLPNSSPTTANDMLPQTDQKSARPIGNADQLVLAIGLSLAIDVLMGFALNVLPIGLQALSWTLALGLFTTLFALVAMLLRRREMPDESVKMPGIRIRISDYVLIGMALLVASSAIWFSIQRPIAPQPSFTQFWILPADAASKSCDVSIGVQSFEATSVTYRVVMTANNEQAATWSAISLAPKSKWVQSVFIESGTARSVSVEALLYRVDQPGVVYRNVHLTLHMVAPKDGQVQQECTLGG
jgi:uncharacterized membrane protein